MSSRGLSGERLRRLLCGKASPFRAILRLLFSASAPAGRLSLPAGGEKVLQDAGAPERRSLSAQQAAEPLVTAYLEGTASDFNAFRTAGGGAAGHSVS